MGPQGKLDAELLPNACLGGMALKALLNAGLDTICVVVRPGDDLGWLPAEVRGREVIIKVCERASEGMSRSLQCGLESVAAVNPDAVLVVLADQPFVTSELLREVVYCWEKNPELDYATCGYGELTSPPALLSKAMFPAVFGLSGDQGAKRLFASPSYAGRVHDAASQELLLDVDTQEDLEAAKRYLRNRYVQ
jgi:molybdenum cofactor cytidylyltransferase